MSPGDKTGLLWSKITRKTRLVPGTCPGVVPRAIGPKKVTFMCLDLFENPCDRDPNRKFQKTSNSSRIPLKYLTFTFGEITFYFLGEITFTLGDSRRSLGFWGNFICCWGGGGSLGTLWVGGGPWGGFRKEVFCYCAFFPWLEDSFETASDTFLEHGGRKVPGGLSRRTPTTWRGGGPPTHCDTSWDASC